MSKTMIGDYIIDTSDIVSISESVVDFKIPSSARPFVRNLDELESEKYTIFKVSLLKEPRQIIIYNKEGIYTHLDDYLSRISHSQTPWLDAYMIDTIEQFGPKMVFGRRWTNYEHMEHLVFDPDIQSKQDFFKKYISE